MGSFRGLGRALAPLPWQDGCGLVLGLLPGVPGGRIRALKYGIPLFVFVGGLVLSTSLSYGKAEYTKKEKKPCAYCHVTATSKELNDAGKYYKEKKTLEGYKAKEKKG